MTRIAHSITIYSKKTSEAYIREGGIKRAQQKWWREDRKQARVIRGRDKEEAGMKKGKGEEGKKVPGHSKCQRQNGVVGN